MKEEYYATTTYFHYITNQRREREFEFTTCIVCSNVCSRSVVCSVKLFQINNWGIVAAAAGNLCPAMQWCVGSHVKLRTKLWPEPERSSGSFNKASLAWPGHPRLGRLRSDGRFLREGNPAVPCRVQVWSGVELRDDEVMTDNCGPTCRPSQLRVWASELGKTRQVYPGSCDWVSADGMKTGVFWKIIYHWTRSLSTSPSHSSPHLQF